MTFLKPWIRISSTSLALRISQLMVWIEKVSQIHATRLRDTAGLVKLAWLESERPVKSLIWYLIYLGSFFAPIGTIECFFQKTSKESLISAFTLQPWHCVHKLGRIVKQGHGAFHPRKLGVVISDLLKQACCNAWSIWNVHIVSYTVIVSTLIPDSSWRGYLEWCPLRVAVTNDGFILNWWDVG